MTSPIIRTRAEPDPDASITLTFPSSSSPSPSTTPSFSLPPPSSSNPLDSLWSSYSSYLDSALTSLSTSLTIHPCPSFTLKASLTPPHPPPPASSSSSASPPPPRKLFINVCTHPAVDAPAVEGVGVGGEGGAGVVGGVEGGGGRVRVPMSVGPVVGGMDRGGQACVVVDVVVHPSAVTVEPLGEGGPVEELHGIVQGQVEMMARREGRTGERLPTPSEMQTMAVMRVRRTLAAIALGKVKDKYQLEVREEEPRFPKRAYQGPLPPPSQNIRRNPDNPLHQLVESSAKSLIEEMPAPRAPAASTPSADTSEVKQKGEGKEQSALVEEKGREAKQQEEEKGRVVESQEQGEVTAGPVTPRYELTRSEDGCALTLQVCLPGVVSARLHPRSIARCSPLPSTDIPPASAVLRSRRVLMWMSAPLRMTFT